MLCAVVLGQQGWVASGRWGSGGGQVGHVAQGWVARGQAGQGSQVAWLPLTACTRCSPCSMSDLAVPFLVLFKDDALAFWCFAALMRKARRNFAHDDAGLFTQLRCAAPAAQTLPASHPERFRAAPAATRSMMHASKWLQSGVAALMAPGGGVGAPTQLSTTCTVSCHTLLPAAAAAAAAAAAGPCPASSRQQTSRWTTACERWAWPRTPTTATA